MLAVQISRKWELVPLVIDYLSFEHTILMLSIYLLLKFQNLRCAIFKVCAGGVGGGLRRHKPLLQCLSIVCVYYVMLCSKCYMLQKEVHLIYEY